MFLVFILTGDFGHYFYLKYLKVCLIRVPEKGSLEILFG